MHLTHMLELFHNPPSLHNNEDGLKISANSAHRAIPVKQPFGDLLKRVASKLEA